MPYVLLLEPLNDTRKTNDMIARFRLNANGINLSTTVCGLQRVLKLVEEDNGTRERVSSASVASEGSSSAQGEAAVRAQRKVQRFRQSAGQNVPPRYVQRHGGGNSSGVQRGRRTAKVRRLSSDKSFEYTSWRGERVQGREGASAQR